MPDAQQEDYQDDYQGEEATPQEAPRQWDELSLSEKNAFIASAVKHGITNMEDIKKAYTELSQGQMNDAPEEEGNKFLKGGYKPSRSIRNYIANKEGASMKTNRSFEEEAQSFWSVLPKEVRSKLTQEQADALYSYSYNVGAGNFKHRVVPALQRYFSGNGSMEDVQRHMYATKDSQLRGLANRRAEERAMFAGSKVPVYYDAPDDTPTVNMGNAWRSSKLGPVTSINTSRGLGVLNNNSFNSNALLGPISNMRQDNPMVNESINTLYDEARPTLMEVPQEDSSLDRYNAIQDYLSSLNPFGYAKGGRMYDKGGVTSSNGQYHVEPSEYSGVLSNASNGNPLEVTLPDTTVLANDPRNYRSYYDPDGAGEFIDATTLGLFPNPFNLSRSASTFMQKPSWDSAWDTTKDALMFAGSAGKEAAFAPLGLMNLVDRDGVRKTYDLAKEGNYAGAAMSGLGDALNMGMAAGPTVAFIKPKYDFYKAAREFNKDNQLIKPTLSSSTTKYPLRGKNQIPLDIKRDAAKRYSDFIESEDYLDRLRNAGMEDHWDYMKDLTQRRLMNNGYFSGNVKTIINGNPKSSGLSSVEPSSQNFGITLQEDLSAKEIPRVLDHEISHWSTGNAGVSDIANSMRYPFRNDVNVSKMGDIMRYNESIVPNIEWDDIRSKFAKSISLDKATELYDDYLYLIEPTEKRARAYAMYQQAKNENLSIDAFVDKYTKNGRITDDAPDQLQDLADIMTPVTVQR